MRRSQLAHVLRAAATVVEDGDILVIGSQSILASYDEDELPDRAVASIEVDVAFFNDPGGDKSDLVDGAIGEMSAFHELHGVYGQGVTVDVATLPEGWRDRVVPFERYDTPPSHARCLDPHDLVISKLVAGREKDFEFAGALIDARLISVRILLQRARMTQLDRGALERLIANIRGFDRGAAVEL